jgi:hypothetical protein
MNMALGMEHKVLARSASCGDCKLVSDLGLCCDMEAPAFFEARLTISRRSAIGLPGCCRDPRCDVDACLEVPGFINIHENGLVRHAGSSSFIVRAIVVVRDDT